MNVVSDPSANAEEKIERAARVLRASKQNKEVFKVIYTGSRRYKSVDDLRKSVTNFNTNTYKAAARLYGEDIVDRKVINGIVHYGKKDFYIHHRQRILGLSGNLERLKKIPTKRKVQVQIAPKSSYSFRTKPRVKQIYIDDIDSFKKVRGVRSAPAGVIRKMAERKINRGICTILNQSEKKDWGGERHDIYTNKIQFKGRKSAAFALKGKAVKTKLTPAKMGKNGDQIPRLFESTADIYFVAHNRDIDDRIVDLMQTHSLKNSLADNKPIYFCVIDGDDLARLVAAYPRAFGLRHNA